MQELAVRTYGVERSHFDMEELAVRNLWRRAVTFPHGRASSEKLVKENGHISACKG